MYNIIAKDTHPNLFINPPFQIDADFGMTTGIAELLIQSHDGLIDLLPALPKDLQSGNISGLRPSRGFEVKMSWRNGVINGASIISLQGQFCVLRTNRLFKISGVISAKETEGGKYTISLATKRVESTFMIQYFLITRRRDLCRLVIWTEPAHCYSNSKSCF